MKIKSIISIALVLLCISCSNDEALDNTSSAKKLEVVNLKDFIDANSQTRSISNTNQAVLRFKDYNALSGNLKRIAKHEY